MKLTNELDYSRLNHLKKEMTRFMLAYKFALDEVSTKINILEEEFQLIHEYNPIEHINTRLKTPESIIKKAHRKNVELSLSSIKENMRDIAGIRINCSFNSDIYKLSEMIQKQRDIEVIEYKDYIQNPKPNGYRSLHLILKIPVFMTDRVEHVFVEMQIRTIAMDFWASLEHKIFYKFNKSVPEKITKELKEAAESANELDQKMENLQKEVNEIKRMDEEFTTPLFNEKNDFNIPLKFLEMMNESSKISLTEV
ncbi:MULTISPECIES: GTP pyrophosphokinase family protein [Sporosarcina]|uniref:GTP pyrophosphokinase n=1 Tax=Sporosarcina psychrophila TaxID=1476 RepID=A0ABV2K1I9_SPOPS|nr:MULTISPECIES: GTP pyrophosphokinase family protein [Sporosarcina]AMQ08273.1 GTP pyrophosphokinase [Sporosarcina psychrophila]